MKEEGKKVNYTRTDVTPYTLQVIYNEYIAIQNKELDLPTAIFKMNGLTVKEFAGISDKEMEQKDVVNIFFNKFVEVLEFHRNAEPLTKNYLEGNGGSINKTNKALSIQGKPTMQVEVANSKLANSSILTFMFLTLLGRLKERNSLDRELLKKEILETESITKYKDVSLAIEDLHTKTQEIKNILASIAQEENKIGLETISHTIDKIKEDILLKKGGTTKQSSDKEVEELQNKLNEVLELTRTRKESGEEVSTKVSSVLHQFELTLNEIRSLSKDEGYTIELLRNRTIKTNERVEEVGTEITNNLIKTQELIENIKESQEQLDLLGLVDNINKAVNNQDVSKLELQNLINVITEVQTGVLEVTETSKVLESVLSQLVEMQKKDSLMETVKAQREMGRSINLVETLGEEYVRRRDRN